MMLALTLLISLLLGLLPCLWFFNGKQPFPGRVLFNLSAPLGVGISSVIFIILNLIGLPVYLIFLLELALIGFAIYRYKIFQNNNLRQLLRPTGILNTNELFKNPLLLLITVVYAYAWLMNAGIFTFDTIKEPHGLWDAWNYWNLKAKLISKAPDIWPTLFHRMGSEEYHVDYPLLQTGFIALCWMNLKSETVLVPIILAFVFTFCTVGLLSSAVSFFTNKTKGLIAGLLLLATPFFMTMGDSQYADNTVGFFFLATTILLTFARSENVQRPQLFIAAGITAGLSAWSKNEGLLFIVCLFLSQVPLIFFKNFRELFHELKYIVYGMLPTLILIFYYKTNIAPPNDIVHAQGSETLVKITDPTRYALINQWFYQTFGTFGKWFINPWWLFIGAALYLGISFKAHKNSLIAGFSLLLLMMCGFYSIYVITPLELTFHLSTSIHRLFFQLFPTFIFIYFLALKPRTSNIKKQ
jgi:hypothetical protein